MKELIHEKLSDHFISIHNDEDLFIADYKHYERHHGIQKYDGKVVILNTLQEDWKSVHLSNKNRVEICFDGFDDNALVTDEPGAYNSQCECVLFPNDFQENSWILFIETKYTASFENAFRKENNYPHSMTEQIIKTVKYFRDKAIIPIDRKVHALVAFPILAEDFNSYFFQGKELEIFKEHKIIIRATNSAIVKSSKRISLR